MKRLALCLLALPMALMAQEPTTARLPYGVAYQQVKAFDQLAHLDKLQFGTSISSTDPSVKPEDIVVTLDDSGELHAFPLGPEGEIKIPIREDWLQGDTRFLQTNQPSGSLRFNAHFSVKPLPSATLDYSYLLDLANQLEQAMASQPGVPADAPDEVDGLIFDYMEGQQATLTIQAAAGPQTHSVDGEGHIHLSLDPALMAENPEVRFSEVPNNIRPKVVP